MKEFFEFAGSTGLGVWMRDSRYAFPIFEMAHLLGLGMLLGSIFLFNARFFGLGLRRQRPSDLVSDFAPWILLSLILMAVSGVPLFASKADDLWSQDRTGFYLKMSLIAVGVLFHYGVQSPLARKDNFTAGRVAAAVSLMLWFGAALAGLSLEFL